MTGGVHPSSGGVGVGGRLIGIQSYSAARTRRALGLQGLFFWLCARKLRSTCNDLREVSDVAIPTAWRLRVTLPPIAALVALAYAASTL